MIPQRNLSLLSNRLARSGGRRIHEPILERDYCIAWFLVGLGRSPLGDWLAFKGGTAIKRCYFGDYRFSEDMDFTLLGREMTIEALQEELQPVFAEARSASGIEFRVEAIEPHPNTHTLYIGYDGPLPRGAGKRVKTDITIRERVVFSPENRPVLRGYEEYADLPEDQRIRVYSLLEISAEKVVALLDPARNEPRDLFDVWYLVQNGHIDLQDARFAVDEKLSFRGKSLDEVRDVFRSKEPRYSLAWDTRLSAQMAQLPPFEAVYRQVRRAMRQAELA